MSTDNVTTTWIYQGYLVQFTVNDTNRDTVDAWITSVSEIVNAWPDSRPYLAIHDFTQAKSIFTPYTRSKAVDLLKMARNKKGRVAIVMPNDNFALQMIRLVLRGLGSMSLATQLFFSIPDARQWLEHMLPAEANEAKQPVPPLN